MGKTNPAVENRQNDETPAVPNATEAQPSSPQQPKRKRMLPILAVFAVDTALMGLCLLALCAYLFLIPRPLLAEEASAPVPSEKQAAVTAAPVVRPTEQTEAVRHAQAKTAAPPSKPTVSPSKAAVPTAAPTVPRASDGPPAAVIAPEKVETGGWFPHMFTDSEIVQSEDSYQSPNVNITIQKGQQGDNVYFVADIYVRSLEHLRTSLAHDTFGTGFRESVSDMAERREAILAISGDYYGNQSRGVVIRNGTVYRKSINSDVCVLYLDGTMQTYDKRAFSMEEALEKGIYQAWSFGPRLLDDGQPMTEFNTSVAKENPRAAIGYYEPGHYCFVVVDGRQRGYSEGMTMEELSQLFAQLGCTDAYNLDGGQTAQMYFVGEIVNQPSQGGREVSDIVYIGE